MRRYLADVFLYKKKHFPKILAKIAAFIICPFVNMTYQAMHLIPTYPDARFRKTLHESIDTILGGQSVIIFPEDSSDGYRDFMIHFYAGFVALAHLLWMRETDVLICCVYYRRKDRTVLVDEPVRYSELLKEGYDKRRIADRLRERVNALSEVTVTGRPEK